MNPSRPGFSFCELPSAAGGRMIFYVIKVAITAMLVVSISEVSKRSTLVGGILVAIPVVSFLSFIWMYFETKDTERIASLSTSIFWMVLPSLPFFVLFPFLLHRNIGFFVSLMISTAVMLVLFFLMVQILGKFGIKL
jgi:hypothetical protein